MVVPLFTYFSDSICTSEFLSDLYNYVYSCTSAFRKYSFFIITSIFFYAKRNIDQLPLEMCYEVMLCYNIVEV